MAVVHNTTMTPGKLELLAAWLPAQPWYAGGGDGLRKAGGFRLDDPDGEVGMEFMAVGDGRRVHHVPMTYRGAPLAGADHALIGTSEHGVLGRRWVYDGAHDPVLQAQLAGLLQGRAEPQAQNASGTPDPSVTGHFAGEPFTAVTTTVADHAEGTDLVVDAGAGRRLTVRVVRVLQAGAAEDAQGHVTAGWTGPDGAKERGAFVVVRGER
jgi:hypothetical protein